MGGGIGKAIKNFKEATKDPNQKEPDKIENDKKPVA
ncbi:MAG: twin-arginine translocase TatA/TatE family subunit [Desulfatirhabdiaceae bacterium]|nr:twin-arginine translocase TatA/TatE family subunit [Desulfatirhabdiaceae bacterium]